MKHFIRYFYALSVLLLSSSGAEAAGVVNVITQVNGVASTEGGQVTAEVDDGTCTLTVIPATGYFMATDHIKAVKMLAGNEAQSRRQAPVLAEPIELTPLDVENPSGKTVYVFIMPESPYDVEVTADFQKMFIPPIVDEDDEKEGVPTTDVTYELVDFVDLDGNPIDLSNVVVNDVLYTLPDDDPTHPQGFDLGTSDGHPGIVLGTSMTEADIAEAGEKTPGTKEYAETFKGITLLLPAGTGHIRIVAETDPGAALIVKIGEEKPLSFRDLTFSMEVWVNYERLRDTYVKIYLAPQTSDSRSKNGVRRDKRETATVKVTGLTVRSSSMITAGVEGGAPQVKLYELLPSNFVNGGRGIVMGSVCDQPITDLGNNVFGAVDDKEGVDYIDMSESAVQGLGSAAPSRADSKAPARSARLGGLLEGFSDHTLVFLPSGNDDGGDSNIIIDGVCGRLLLDSHASFCSPYDFTAASVTLNRTFTKGRATTLVLPFTIPALEASAAGRFHRFNKIENGYVLFDEAEVGEIPANTPVVFFPDATELTVSSVSVENSVNVDAEPTEGFFGNYSRRTAPTRTFSFIPTGQETIYGQFMPMGASDMLEPFSAYLRVNSDVSVLNMIVGSLLPTGIETVGSNAFHAYPVYNLGGQLVAHPGKGLYIVNGRKVVFK